MELEHSAEQGAKRLSLNVNCVLTALKLVLEILRVRYGCCVAQSVTFLTCNSEGAVFDSRTAHPLSWLRLFGRLVAYIQDCAALVTQITPRTLPSALWEINFSLNIISFDSVVLRVWLNKLHVCLFVFATTAPWFLDHTQRRTTDGRTPLDKWSARRRDLYLTTHNTHDKRHTPGGIRTYNLSRRAAADRAATGTGK